MNFYYENHLGEIIYFYNSPYILTGHAFADWALSYATANNKSSGFKIKPVTMAFTVQIAPRSPDPEGREARYAYCIDRFVEIVSKDADMGGKLWTTTGEYLVCKIVTSKKTNWNKHRLVTLSCTLLADYPYWIRERSYTYHLDDTMQYPYLGYMFDYKYDYRGVMDGYAEITIDSTEESNFRLTIHGSAYSPKVLINNVLRGAEVGLGEDENLVIDTMKKTVTKETGGFELNVFANRLKGNVSIFDKLPPGNISVQWIGALAFDLTVYEERREPQWS